MHEREGERDEVEAEPEARMADMRRAPPNCALANVPPCPNRAGASPAVLMPAPQWVYHSRRMELESRYLPLAVAGLGPGPPGEAGKWGDAHHGRIWRPPCGQRVPRWQSLGTCRAPPETRLNDRPLEVRLADASPTDGAQDTAATPRKAAVYDR
jgi:hypothetical protein